MKLLQMRRWEAGSGTSRMKQPSVAATTSQEPYSSLTGALQEPYRSLVFPNSRCPSTSTDPWTPLIYQGKIVVPVHIPRCVCQTMRHFNATTFQLKHAPVCVCVCCVHVHVCVYTPMKAVTLGLMIPLGRRWKSYSTESTTTVWPALLPPCREGERGREREGEGKRERRRGKERGKFKDFV